MSHTLQRIVGVSVVAVTLTGASFAFAQTGIDAPPVRPLDMLRAQKERSKELQRQNLSEDRDALIEKTMEVNAGMRTERRDFRMNVIDVMRTMHTEVRAQLSAATSSDARKDILRDARMDRAEFRLQVHADAELLRDSFQDRRSGLRDERRALAGERFSMMMRRLVNALERFDQILARIDSRIEKLAADGIDTDTAVEASAAASVAIDAASVAVADAKAAIETAAGSDSPQNEMDGVRAAIRTAIEAVKDAHQALRDAMRAVKEIAPDEDESANGSATTTTE